MSRVTVTLLELWIHVDFDGCEQREGFHFLSSFLIGGIKTLPTIFRIKNGDYTNVNMNDFSLIENGDYVNMYMNDSP